MSAPAPALDKSPVEEKGIGDLDKNMLIIRRCIERIASGVQDLLSQSNPSKRRNTLDTQALQVFASFPHQIQCLPEPLRNPGTKHRVLPRRRREAEGGPGFRDGGGDELVHE